MALGRLTSSVQLSPFRVDTEEFGESSVPCSCRRAKLTCHVSPKYLPRFAAIQTNAVRNKNVMQMQVFCVREPRVLLPSTPSTGTAARQRQRMELQ